MTDPKKPMTVRRMLLLTLVFGALGALVLFALALMLPAPEVAPIGCPRPNPSDFRCS